MSRSLCPVVSCQKTINRVLLAADRRSESGARQRRDGRWETIPVKYWQKLSANAEGPAPNKRPDVLSVPTDTIFYRGDSKNESFYDCAYGLVGRRRRYGD